MKIDGDDLERVWGTKLKNKYSAFDHKIFVCKKRKKQFSIQGEMLNFCPSCGRATVPGSLEIIKKRLKEMNY